MPGLVPGISLRKARLCPVNRDGRDIRREDGASRLLPGHDELRSSFPDVDQLHAAIFGGLRVGGIEQLLLAKADSLDARR
jgi:hypothetical protein